MSWPCTGPCQLSLKSMRNMRNLYRHLLFLTALVGACSWDRSVGLWKVTGEQTVWEAATYLSGSKDDAAKIRVIKDTIVEKNPNLTKPVYILEGQIFTIPYSSVASPARWETYTSYGCTPFLEFPGQGRPFPGKPAATDSLPTRDETAQCVCATESTAMTSSIISTAAGSVSQSPFPSWTSLPSSGAVKGPSESNQDASVALTRTVQAATQSSGSAPSASPTGGIMCRDGNGKVDAESTQQALARAFCIIQMNQTLQANNSTLSQLLYTPYGGLYYFSVQWTVACPATLLTAGEPSCMNIMKDIHTTCTLNAVGTRTRC